MTVKELKEQLDSFDDNLLVKVKNNDGTHDNINNVEHTVIKEHLKYPQMFIDTRRMEFVSLRLEQ